MAVIFNRPQIFTCLKVLHTINFECIDSVFRQLVTNQYGPKKSTETWKLQLAITKKDEEMHTLNILNKKR